MVQFTILENMETGTTKYFALRVALVCGCRTVEADCVVCEYYDANSDSSSCEIVSVEPEELEGTIKALEDQIIAEM